MNTVHKILDIFEDFLDDKGVWIENEDREGDEGEAILYGMDYSRLYEEINELLATEPTIILENGQHKKLPVYTGNQKIIMAVDRALTEYSADRICVLLDYEDEWFDVMICSRHDSFAYMCSVAKAKDVQKDDLKYELNKRHVGYCW